MFLSHTGMVAGDICPALGDGYGTATSMINGLAPLATMEMFSGRGVVPTSNCLPHKCSLLFPAYLLCIFFFDVQESLLEAGCAAVVTNGHRCQGDGSFSGTLPVSWRLWVTCGPIGHRCERFGGLRPCATKQCTKTPSYQGN